MQDAAPPPALAAPAPAPAPAPAGKLVLDILAPPPPAPQQSGDCLARDADPFQPEILVCQTAALPQRLTRQVGPALDDFGNAIPRARVKLSDKAQGEANLINQSVGGFNANGAEVRLKIDF